MSKTNKTLVVNMQHVKTNLIPPRSGPNPQGLNIGYNTVKTVKLEKINGRDRKGLTQRGKKRS